MTPDEIDERSHSAIRRWLADKKNQAAFEDLLRLHRKAVLKVVAARMRRDEDDDDVQEMAQACWVEVLEKLETYQPRPGSRFRGWLLTIVRRRCIDARKHANTRGEKDKVSIGQDVEVASHDPKPEVHPMDMDALRAELAQAVAALPEVDREILRARNEEGLEFAAIAERLGKTTAFVSGRYYSAAGKLDEFFNKYAL